MLRGRVLTELPEEELGSEAGERCAVLIHFLCKNCPEPSQLLSVLPPSLPPFSISFFSVNGEGWALN